MKRFSVILLLMVSVLSACGGTAAEETFTPIAGSGEGGAVSYSLDVAPILMQSCWNCHGGEKVSRGFDMSDYVSLMKGSTKGAQIIAGDSASSGLYVAISTGKMPKKGGMLSPEQIELIQRWIDEGAKNN